MFSNAPIKKNKFHSCHPMVLAVVMSCALSACVTQPTYTKPQTVVINERGVPNLYKVERGETVSKIANRYGLNWRDVAKLNRLDSQNTIYTGQWLVLWKGNVSHQKTTNASQNLQVQTVATPRPHTPNYQVSGQSNPPKAIPQPQATTYQPPITQPPVPQPTPPTNTNHASLVGSVGLMQFVYPVAKHSKVVRHFGEVRQVNGMDTKFDGMWFNGNDGDAIMASRAGTVIYAGGDNTQTPFISIRHADGFTSEYRFLKDVTVKQGQNVTAGQRIASMKASNGAALTEFRILKGNVYIDPLSVLK